MPRVTRAMTNDGLAFKDIPLGVPLWKVLKRIERVELVVVHDAQARRVLNGWKEAIVGDPVVVA